MRPGRADRGRAQLGIGVVMLASQLLNVGLDRIPPVTLATIAGQVALFVNLVKPPWSRYNACISVFTVLKQGDYKRIIISTFEHADEWHLYYNMVSFLWKGMRLEQRFGSRKFAILLGVFTVSCSLMYLLLAKAATNVLMDDSYSKQCAIGFSGVIFALKVLTHQYEAADGGWTRLRGLAVPARWAVWAELVLIHLLAPGSSLLGHLAGILVGLAFTHGPLRPLVDTLDKLIAVPAARAETRRSGTSYTYHSGASGHRSGSSSTSSAGGSTWRSGPGSGPGSGSGSGFGSSSGSSFGSSFGSGPGFASGSGLGPGSSSGSARQEPPPPGYGWNVPAAAAPEPAADPELAEAIRRSRLSHAEEVERRRRPPQPSAPPPPPPPSPPSGLYEVN